MKYVFVLCCAGRVLKVWYQKNRSNLSRYHYPAKWLACSSFPWCCLKPQANYSPISRVNYTLTITNTIPSLPLILFECFHESTDQHLVTHYITVGPIYYEYNDLISFTNQPNNKVLDLIVHAIEILSGLTHWMTCFLGDYDENTIQSQHNVYIFLLLISIYFLYPFYYLILSYIKFTN